MHITMAIIYQDVVQLNVGGALYTTTKVTLGRFPNSMLGAMFSGSLPITCDEDGRYFIDRDGSLFGYILNFMRSSRLALPDDFKHFDQLAIEADFYQIEPLIQAVYDARQRVRHPKPMGGHLLEVIEVRTGSTATILTNNSRVKTIISGRRDLIIRLPSQYVGAVGKPQHTGSLEFIELELKGSNVRLRLAEYLQENAWKRINTHLSSSSGYDSKSMISSLIIEQTYRDRWFLAEDVQHM